MLSVRLSKSQQSLDGRRVVGVLLALEDHLLEAEDDLILALLGQLLVEVLLGAAAVFLVALLDLVLGLLVDVLVDLALGGRDGGILSRDLVHRLIPSGDSTSRSVLRHGSVGTSVGHVLGIFLGVSAIDALGLLPEVLLGQIRSLVPGVVGGGLVNLRQLLLVGAHTIGGTGSGVSDHVAEEDRRVADCMMLAAFPSIGWLSGGLTKLAELAIGDEQSTQGSQALERLVAISLGRVLANRRIGALYALGVVLPRLPDEVLDQVALVLGEKQLLGELDNVARVLDERLAVVGELIRRARERAGLKEAVEGDIDLVVLQSCQPLRHGV